MIIVDTEKPPLDWVPEMTEEEKKTLLSVDSSQGFYCKRAEK